MSELSKQVEKKIKELLHVGDKEIINGDVPEDERVSHIMIVDDTEVRVREDEDAFVWEAEDVCEYCGGTGEITTMESVYAGEPHQAPIGTQTCICQLEEE